MKNFFLISDLNLLWYILRPLPLALLLVTWKKMPTPASLQQAFLVPLATITRNVNIMFLLQGGSIPLQAQLWFVTVSVHGLK